ncbi:class I SAM-dependent methyltransferase [Nesterenkonia sphaerica]|uniref:Methyltransferase n=1 Tax=Nesterenkonia sphaerica TaxID=1804988 RepID=A0A5R9A9R8_9MICC|nr:methyltransferase [Nesterenkonia sphaerica]TLP75519.1 methyltransferase [Nesterenkonia sphaerica]
MNSAHYFDSPTGPFERRRVEVTLAGQRFTALTAGGIFSPDGIDKGTETLLREVPAPAQTGNLLDIGCGWGPIALTQAKLAPQAHVWAVDVNERARTLAAENATALGLDNVTVCAPEEVPTGMRFDTIWSNPPIRIGKPALHQLLQLWLPRLEAGGEAHLVVQKNLGADSLLTWLKSMLAAVSEDFSVDRVASVKGFRILRIRRRPDQ